MKISELIKSVRNKIDDEDSPTDEQLVDIMNEGRKILSRETLCYEKETSYSSAVINKLQKIPMPSDMYMVKTIVHKKNNTQKELEPIDIREMDKTKVQHNKTYLDYYLEQNRNITFLPYLLENSANTVYAEKDIDTADYFDLLDMKYEKGTGTTSYIPLMTSDSQDGFVLTSDFSPNSGTSLWQAFDGDADTYCMFFPITDEDAVIGNFIIELDKPMNVNKVLFDANFIVNDSSGGITDTCKINVNLLGSDNGTDWTLITEVLELTLGVGTEQQSIALTFTNNNAYAYYKVEASQSERDGAFCYAFYTDEIYLYDRQAIGILESEFSTIQAYSAGDTSIKLISKYETSDEIAVPIMSSASNGGYVLTSNLPLNVPDFPIWNAFDRDDTTVAEWLNLTIDSRLFVNVEMNEPTIVNKYSIKFNVVTNAFQFGATGVQFVGNLLGSDDGVEWVILDEIVNQRIVALDSLTIDKTATITNKRHYKYYSARFYQYLPTGDASTQVYAMDLYRLDLYGGETSIIGNTLSLPLDGKININNELVRYVSVTRPNDYEIILNDCFRGFEDSTAVTADNYDSAYETDIWIKYYALPENLSYNTPEESGTDVDPDLEDIFSSNPESIIYYMCWQSKLRDLDDVSSGIQYQEQMFRSLYEENKVKLKLQALSSQDMNSTVRML